MPPPMPKFARLIALCVSALVLLSNGAGAFFALRATPEAYWGWMGFEVVMAVASAFGIMLGLGRYREGSGLAAACVAGAWFVGSGMGRLQVHAAPSDVLRDTWFLARFGCAALVATAGAITVLSRDGRSWKKLAMGLAMLCVVGGIGVFFAKTGGMWLGTPQSGAMDVARKSALVAVVIGTGVLFCIGAHLVIAAFEMGVPQGQPGAPTPLKPSSDGTKAARA